MLPLNATFEKTSIFNSTFNCRIDNENIFQTDYLGNPIGQIGVSVKKYKELKDICDKYYQKLIELGAIPQEKTPEELAIESQKMMSEMLSQMKLMQQQINEMKEKDNVRPDKFNSDGGKNDGVKPGTNQKSK